MRHAILYTIRSEEVLCGSVYTAHNFTERLDHVAGEGDTYLSRIKSPQSTQMPIHHIRRCVKPSSTPLRPSQYDCQYEDHFFAIEPALAEILMAPFKQELNEYKSKLEASQSRIMAFNQMPIWRRIFIALTNRIP